MAVAGKCVPPSAVILELLEFVFMVRKYVILWLVLVPDIILLYASLWLAVSLRYEGGLDAQGWSTHVQAFSAIFVAWVVIFFIYNLFEVSTFRRYSVLLRSLLSATATNGLVAVLYFYSQPGLIITPRRFLLILLGVSFVLILGWHLVVKYFLKNRMVEYLYAFSFQNELAELVGEIRKHDFLGYRIVAHLHEDTLDTTEIIKNAGIIVPDTLHLKPGVLNQLYRLRKRGVVFYSHTLFYERLLRKVYLSEVTETWFLENVSYKEKRLYIILKRGVDVLAGLVGLILFVVSFPLVAVLIKLSSPGTILFIQERVGEGDKRFFVYKYRTMQGIVTNTWTAQNDSRITSIGKVLRRSRLDELPQCINLLLGNMSLVGPRPEQPHLVESLTQAIPFYNERHWVKPGLTGWAQINDSYASSVAETRRKLQYDLYYIKHRSLLLDIEIIFKTLYYVLAWKGR